jgi:RNA polymerase sigma-70 factor, ECF subfamily
MADSTRGHGDDSPSADRTSASLLQRARANDRDAWERLVHLYAPLVSRWCRRWGVSGADAEDVVQEVFQATAASLSNFRKAKPGDTFRGWLYGITRFKLLDFARRIQAQPRASGGSEGYQQIQNLPEQEPPDDPETAQEVGGVFHRALEMIRAEFEPSTWQAFWRTTVAEEETAAVATALGMTTAAVRKAKSRVLRRLREELGELLE